MKSVLASCAVAFMVGACAVSPKATTEVATDFQQMKSAKSLVTAYYLQSTRLDIVFKNSGDAKAEKWGLAVTNEPTEATDKRLLLKGHRDLFSRTALTVSKRANTDLIASIGSEVTDNRTTLIQNAGAVLKAGIAIAAVVAGSAPAKPFTAHWSLDEPGDFVKATSAIPGWEAWHHRQITDLTIAVGPPPVTATKYDARLFGTAKGILMSACRPVIVRYELSGEEHEWRGKIADPASLEFVPLPAKGKVEFHAQCGASITFEKDPTATTDALLAAAAAQAVAVAEAYKKANEK